VESRGQHVQEKAPNELRRGERHRLLFRRRVAAGVLVTEAHVPALDVEHTMIRNRDAMRVATDIVQHLLRSGKRGFGVDHPLGLPCRREVIGKGLPTGQRVERPDELQPAPVERVV